MEKYELQNRIRVDGEEIDTLHVEIARLRQKQEVYNRHLEIVNRQEEAGESLYFYQRQKLNSVLDLARGRAIESAMCEYDDLFGAERWGEAQQDFYEIRMIIQKNNHIAEERIREAQKRINLLEERISVCESRLRMLG